MFSSHPDIFLHFCNLLTCCLVLFTAGRDPSVVASYMEHGSLAYGADWCRCAMYDLPVTSYGDPIKIHPPDSSIPEESKVRREIVTSHNIKTAPSTADRPASDRLVSSCSFYDHELHIWTMWRCGRARYQPDSRTFAGSRYAVGSIPPAESRVSDSLHSWDGSSEQTLGTRSNWMLSCAMLVMSSVGSDGSGCSLSFPVVWNKEQMKHDDAIKSWLKANICAPVGNIRRINTDFHESDRWRGVFTQKTCNFLDRILKNWIFTFRIKLTAGTASTSCFCFVKYDTHASCFFLHYWEWPVTQSWFCNTIT